MKKPVQLELHNQQRKIRLPLRRLQRRLEQAAIVLPRRSRLPQCISIVLVSKSAIQRVHRDFFNDDTPTDVITFPYGEILVCPEIARQQGKRWKHSTEIETLLYGIHGMLHLAGFDDIQDRDFEKMRLTQEKVLRQVLSNE